MMNKLQLFIFLVCICMLAGCTEEEENSGIRLIEGTAPGQTIFADETTTDGDIHFTTDGAWTAEVTEASTKAEGSSVSWVTLDKYSGNAAGEYTITVFVRKNYTGADRKAYIRITCGSSITIIIEQKAVTESGDVPVNQEPTYDGEAPYVTVEEQEVVLPAVASGRFFVNFKSNLMEEPAIALELPGEEEGEEYVAAIRGALMCTPDENSQLELEVFPNILDKERRNILRFMTHDNEQLAVVVLRQERGAVCQLLDTQSEVGGLVFRFGTNGQVHHVYYGLSDTRLRSEKEVEEFLADRNRSQELSLSDGAEEFALNFDGLLPATTYYLYMLPVHSAGDAAGAYMMETATTAVQESRHDLVLEVSANRANDFKVYLPFCDDYLKGTVDWGDGTVEKVEGWNMYGVSHQYETNVATTYEVRFSGVLTSLDLVADVREARENTLLSIKQWGYTGLTRIMLSGFSSLKSIAADTEGAFRGMEHFGVEPYGGSFTGTAIESIPDDFFKYAVNATSFDYTFGDCKKLKSIPPTLFANCDKVLYFGMNWLRDSSHRGGLGVFQQCESLQAVPETLFAGCPLAEDMSYAFAGCKALTSLPDNLFRQNSRLEQVEGTFSSCTALTAIPAMLFDNNRKLMNVKSAFSGSLNVEGESPYTVIGNKKVHLYERGDYPTEFVALQEYVRCFGDCTKLTDYSDMPDHW